MAFKRDNEFDMEQVAAYLKDIVAKVESDPETLEELRKVFKKSVPLTRRSYVAAYLLKQSGGAIYRFNARKNREEKFASRRENREENTARRSSRYEERKARDTESAAQERPAAEPREHFNRVQIDPNLSTTIFVGIGRNRRVYPRDLVGLFISVAGLDRDRIGDIRVLANYSFVQLFTEDADKAINALNGYDYRGRKLSVSFSRQKLDGEGEEAPAAEAAPVTEAAVEAPAVEEAAVETYTVTKVETVAQSPAYSIEAQKDLTDEEILAARAPRSSSTADLM